MDVTKRTLARGSLIEHDSFQISQIQTISIEAEGYECGRLRAAPCIKDLMEARDGRIIMCRELMAGDRT